MKRNTPWIKSGLALLAAFTFLLGTTASAQTVNVDDFSDQGSIGPFPGLSTSGPAGTIVGPQTDNGLSGVLGGTRSVTLEVLANQFGGSSRAFFSSAPDAFNVGNDPGNESMVTLDYPNVGSTIPDIDSSGSVDFTFQFSDLGVGIDLTFTDGGGNTGTASGVNLSGPGTTSIPLAAIAAAGVDFNDIQSIQLVFTAPPGGDFTLTGFELPVAQAPPGEIPEPASMLAWGLLGGLGLWRAARRRAR